MNFGMTQKRILGFQNANFVKVNVIKIAQKNVWVTMIST